MKAPSEKTTRLKLGYTVAPITKFYACCFRNDYLGGTTFRLNVDTLCV